jgi:hypothetical protein
MADFGLEIYNAAGQKTLSVTDSLTKYVGAFSIGQNAPNGSAVYPALAGGRPFAMVLRTSTDPAFRFVPQITFSGTTVYWTFGAILGSGTSNRAACRIILGTY